MNQCRAFILRQVASNIELPLCEFFWLENFAITFKSSKIHIKTNASCLSRSNCSTVKRLLSLLNSHFSGTIMNTELVFFDKLVEFFLSPSNSNHQVYPRITGYMQLIYFEVILWVAIFISCHGLQSLHNLMCLSIIGCLMSFLIPIVNFLECDIFTFIVYVESWVN